MRLNQIGWIAEFTEFQLKAERIRAESLAEDLETAKNILQELPTIYAKSADYDAGIFRQWYERNRAALDRLSGKEEK